MRAKLVGAYKRAKVVEDPIGASQPLRPYVLRNTPVPFPYKEPYPKEYPITSENYPQYAELDYQLGYVGRIVLDELKTKGIFVSVNRYPSRVDFSYKSDNWFLTLDGIQFLEALLGNKSLTIQDDKHTHGIFKLFLDKPEQTTYSAKVVILKVAIPADVINNYPFISSSSSSTSSASTSTSSSSTSTLPLESSATVYYSARVWGIDVNEASFLINPQTKIFSEFYEVIKNNARLLSAKNYYYWDSDFPFIRVDDGTYEIDGTRDIIGVISKQSVDAPYNSISNFKISSFATSSRVDGLFDVAIERINYKYVSSSVGLENKAFVITNTLFEGQKASISDGVIKVESVAKSPVYIVSNPVVFSDITLYRASANQLKNESTLVSAIGYGYTNILGNSKVFIESQEVIPTSYFEDQTADEETEDFLIGDVGLTDTDYYSSYGSGGTANYYAVQPFFGWDTIANNPDLGSDSSDVLVLRTRRDNSTNTIARYKDFIPTFGVNITNLFDVKDILEPNPSLMATDDLKVAEVSRSSLLQYTKLDNVYYGDVSLSNLSYMLDESASLDSIKSSLQPEYVLSPEVNLDYVSSSLDSDFIYGSSELFYKSSSIENSFYESDAVLDSYPSNVNPDYFAPSISVGVNNSFVSSYFKDFKVDEAFTSYYISGLQNYPINSANVSSNQVDSSQYLEVPTKQVNSSFIPSLDFLQVPSFLKVVYNKYDSSFSFSDFWHTILNQDVDDEEWLPTGTWADLKGEPATYFLTFNKIDLTKQNNDPIIKLFLDKPISYIDIWRPYHYTSTGEIVLDVTSQDVSNLGWIRGGIKDYNWVYNFLQFATQIKYIKPTRKIETLMQVGYGYTTPPDVTIDVRGLNEETLVDVLGLEIPPILSMDINANQVFDEGSIDIRKYKLPIIDRAKAEYREFQEWIEETGEVFVFIYGHTFTFHIYTSLQFEGQTFIGCSANGLKIIGKMPPISPPITTEVEEDITTTTEDMMSSMTDNG